MKRLENKIAIVVGAGQGPGTGMGNGRATVIRFAQEGAKVFCVDKDVQSAEETVQIARKEAKDGGDAAAFEADVTREASMKAMIDACKAKWGRIDILHYNVGFSIAGGDAPPTEITEEAFDRIMAVNLRGMVMAVKHALPIMRQQQSAIQNAEYGIRSNVILPGLMDTPMAVDTRARAMNKSRDEVAAMRDARVPLRRKMGTAWDVANAALFLASDEANFITGVQLPVDGGSLVDIGH